MATRYGYSREFVGPAGKEVFSVDSANSFDEAKKIVDKGIYDRQLEIKSTSNSNVTERPDPPKNTAVPLPNK